MRVNGNKKIQIILVTNCIILHKDNIILVFTGIESKQAIRLKTYKLANKIALHIISVALLVLLFQINMKNNNIYNNVKDIENQIQI